jgi:hypothetical protein
VKINQNPALSTEKVMSKNNVTSCILNELQRIFSNSKTSLADETKNSASRIIMACHVLHKAMQQASDEAITDPSSRVYFNPGEIRSSFGRLLEPFREDTRAWREKQAAEIMLALLDVVIVEETTPNLPFDKTWEKTK